MSDIFDAHADSYSDDIEKVLGKYGAKHDWFMSHKSWLLRELLQRQGRTPGEIDLLDVGCGTSKIHSYLKNDFRAITGVDVSDNSLDVARKTHPEIEYKTYDGHRLPFGDSSFDLSMAICVFHHVPPEQWSELAGEMLRILRPDGLCLIIEHNPYNPVTQRIVSTCELDKDAVLLRPSKLRRIFKAVGASEIQTRSILTVPPIKSWLKRLDGTLGVFPFGAQYYLTAKKTSSGGKRN